jgi:glycosyltransferase involved in cell wall biosynthesis
VAKKATKIAKKITMVFDYPICLVVFLFGLVGVVFAVPWILKQRRMWNESAKGNRKALILRKFNLKTIMHLGYEVLLPYRNVSMKWIGFLDPANSLKEDIKITNDFYLISWKSPQIVRFLQKINFDATAMILRESIAVFKITRFCVREQIGVLRAYKYDYPALQACLVASFIKIPFIVDIASNFELIRRLTGRVFYFRGLHSLPVIRIFARMATNWLLGLPLRHASHVLGRNKNNYEHAFALGAPVERLSLLRYNNFSAVFNSYNPEEPPVRPAEYPYVLFVGRLDEIKYPFDVLDAFDLAARHLPEYRLTVIGDGALRQEIEQRREVSRYKDRIMLLGARPNDVVFSWTAHAKVAICPYSGSTLVEAMLCGVPVIAYDVEWHAEVVIDYYTGFLVPFRNTAALAEKMIHVVSHWQEAAIVGKRGRELARVAFDKEKISAGESMYYTQALTK